MSTRSSGIDPAAPLVDEGYDVVGDVHGCADKLVRLLAALGYRQERGAWRHRTRRVVFLGDFIDRGPYQLDAVAIPRAMVAAGAARAILGNHEFNAVGLATGTPGGGWCRPHNQKNLDQTVDFLAAAPFGSSTHREIIDWFRTLPLWLDLDGLRVVHACWHEPSMTLLEPLRSEAGGLTDDLVVQATRRGTPVFEAVKTVLKGPEAHLDGFTHVDADRHRRAEGRFLWWEPSVTTLRNGVRLPPTTTLYDRSGAEADRLPDTPLPDKLLAMVPTDPARPPVLFGHYWFTAGDDDSTVQVINPKAACLDFSAVSGGPLVAYRWSGERELTSANLVAVR
ncbi:MAG: metallophosphoesterase [Actinomycetota bacterium]